MSVLLLLLLLLLFIIIIIIIIIVLIPFYPSACSFPSHSSVPPCYMYITFCTGLFQDWSKN